MKVVITACLDWVLVLVLGSGSLCKGSPSLCSARDGMKTSAKSTKVHKIINHLSISISTATNPVASLHLALGTCSISNQLAWISE